MKRAVFLAISVLSFGVAGLASIAPAVSAVDPATETATITVNVPENVGIAAVDTANVAFGELAVGATKTQDQKVTTVNNTGAEIALTVKMKAGTGGAADNDNVMIGSGAAQGESIAAGTNIAANAANSAWGVKKKDDTNYQIVPASNATGLTLNSLSTNGDTNVTYGIAIGNSQRAGDYTATVEYTYAKPAGS